VDPWLFLDSKALGLASHLSGIDRRDENAMAFLIRGFVLLSATRLQPRKANCVNICSHFMAFSWSHHESTVKWAFLDTVIKCCNAPFGVALM
jgi:hypothetical protein